MTAVIDTHSSYASTPINIHGLSFTTGPPSAWHTGRADIEQQSNYYTHNDINDRLEALGYKRFKSRKKDVKIKGFVFAQILRSPSLKSGLKSS